MKNMKHLVRRGFALFVVLAMCLSLMNLTAFASELEDSDSTVSSEETAAGSTEASDKAGEASSEDPAEEPSEDPAEEPSEDPAEEPSEDPAEEPSEDPAEEPSEDPAEEPSEDPAEEPSEDPAEEPSEDPAETPVEEEVQPEAPVAAPVPAELDEEAVCTCEYLCTWFYGRYININQDCPVCSKATEEELDPYTYDPEHPEDFVCQGHQAVIPGRNPNCTHNTGSMWNVWLPGGGSPDLIPASCKYPATADEAIECMGCGAKWLWKFDADSEPNPDAHQYQMKRGEPVPDETKDATCTEDGYKLYICKLCGEETREVISAEGHKLDPATVTVVEATCLADGSKTGVCTVCGEEITEVLKGGHLQPETGVESTAPTCTEAGSTRYTCVRCGEEVVETAPALGHKFLSVSGSKNGTCANEGCTAVCYGLRTYEAGAMPSGSGYELGNTVSFIREQTADGGFMDYTLDSDGSRVLCEGLPVVINTALMGKTKAARTEHGAWQHTDEDGNPLVSRVVGWRNMDDENGKVYQTGDVVPCGEIVQMYADAYAGSTSRSWGDYHSSISARSVCLNAVREPLPSIDRIDYGELTINPVTPLVLEQTSQGVTVTYSEFRETMSGTHYHVDADILVTITEDAPENADVSVNLFRGLMDTINLQPGDSFNFKVTVNDESGRNYQYVNGSALLGTLERDVRVDPDSLVGYGFDGFPIASVITEEGLWTPIPKRTLNVALQALGAKDSDLSDKAIGGLLAELGYGEEGMDPAEITRTCLGRYYLDYLNKQRALTGEPLVDSFQDVTPDEAYDLLGKNQTIRGRVVETCSDVAEAYYYFSYGRGFTYNGVSIYDHMGDPGILNGMVQEALSSEDRTFTLTGLMDGEYFADTAQHSAYSFSAGLKFRMAQVLPDTGSLTVTKTVSGGGSAAQEKVYSFTVTGPNDYFALVNITGPGSVTLTGLEPGEYTVTEDRDGAAISGYRLSVTGSGEAVEVAVGEIANITIDNAYTTPGGGGGGGGGTTPTPPQDPENPENPETPETPETPEIPEEDVPLTDIPEEETPLSELPEVPEELEIPEEDVPLADVPETGDLGGGWMMAMLMGAMGMLWAALSGKDRKRTESEEG